MWRRDATRIRANGVSTVSLSRSASTGTCAAGMANRRSSGAAAGSSTVSIPLTAWYSSHSRA